MKSDGSDWKGGYVYPNVLNTNGVPDAPGSPEFIAQQKPKLGCGFEKTGPTTLAS